jgi:hypothetical protein
LSFSHQLKCTQTRSIQEAWWFSARAWRQSMFSVPLLTLSFIVWLHRSFSTGTFVLSHLWGYCLPLHLIKFPWQLHQAPSKFANWHKSRVRLKL